MLRLFRNGNFTRLFLGRLTSNMGDSLYAVAAMWLVHELGGSTFFTGLAGFLTLFPQTLQFLAGPFVDRWPLRHTMIWTQVIQGIFLLIVPLLAFFNALSVAAVLVIMPLLTAINQFVYPAENALLPQLIDKKDLVKGNSLFSFSYQGVDIIFTSLAGILVAFLGAVAIYAIDSATFFLAALLFASIRMPNKNSRRQNKEQRSVKKALKNYQKELSEGFSAVFRSLFAKFFLGSIVANFTFGMSIAVLPAYAEMRGGAEMYGYYFAAISAGVLIGALLANAMENVPLGILSASAFFFGGIFWFSSALVSSAALSLLLFAASWISIGATNVIFNAVLQKAVPERLLARVTSVIVSISSSAMPLGSLVGGVIGAWVTPVTILTITGFSFIFITVVWLIFRELRTLPTARTVEPSHLGFRPQNIPDEQLSAKHP